jgi:ribonuclease PH
LFYSGTRTHAIMMEWTSVHDSLPEEQWPMLLELAAATIQPILDTIEAYDKLLILRRQEDLKLVDQPDGYVTKDDQVALTAQLRASLGLPPLLDDDDVHQDTKNQTEESREKTLDEDKPQRQHRNDLLREAITYCCNKIGEKPFHALYGVRSFGIPTMKDSSLLPVAVHRNRPEILTKIHRGRRETIFNQEIYRFVDEYLTTQAGYTLSSVDTNNNENAEVIAESERKWLRQKVGYKLLKHGLWEASWRFGTRSDGRRNIHVGQGWKTIRPLQIALHVLPEPVHGSAIFARGDTQVLCTVTLGAPKEGQPLSDPYQPTTNPRLLATDPEAATEDGSTPFNQLPIGSLRFLRTQEALESDLNSRKSFADKERTGDTGTLAEVKRAFLQYDFPSYSTGQVPKRGGMDRRSIGHGALAERAILPVLPDASVFPYAIRISSEVTDSNGSSSMASVCGATLALRDAGVPLKSSVAGVSVGLAISNGNVLDDEIAENAENVDDDKKYSLLLDITGTEDHVSVQILLV